MAKKASDRSRLHNGLALPASITDFLQLDAEHKQELLGTRRTPKESKSDTVKAHFRQKLLLQQLQTDHALLLYSIWDLFWLGTTDECETLEEMPHPDIWRENALWRSHKAGAVEFMTGVILDMAKEMPEVQLALYIQQPEPLKSLSEMGWVFVEKWGESITTAGLVLLLPSQSTIDLAPFDGLPGAAINNLRASF